MENQLTIFTLPNNLLAEQIVLGSIYIDKSLLPKILEQLKSEAFYFPEHKILYKAIVYLYEKNNSVELTTTVCYLQENKLLKAIGGIKTLTDITEKVTTTVNIEKYIALLQEKYFRRLLILLGKSIIETTYNSEKSLGEILKDVEAKTFKLTTKRFNNSLSNTTELLNDILIDIRAKFQLTSNLSGLSTSYYNLDTLLQGLQNSELLILAGRPSMGKTAFSLNIAKNISQEYLQPVLLFSLEMSKQQLIYRFLAMLTGINSMKIKTANLSSTEWKQLKKAIICLSKLPIFIDDTSSLTFSEIQSKSQQILKQKQKISLIIIDYLQLMELKNLKNNRNQELSVITRSLKILAKELDVPILVLSQLSRTVESRLNKRPILSDLRDSGCLALKNIFSLKKRNTKISITGEKPCYKITGHKNFSISMTSAHKILTNEGWKRVDNFCLKKRLKNLYYTFISSLLLKIKFNDVYKTFDTTILKNHNYIIKNYLLHNSIEQDADVVLMLYRDDYYDKKSLKSGIVEIIIAKNRNGPIGSVNLLFNNRSLKFENIFD